MSQREVTDLVCRAHRHELGVDEQRRLDQLLCVSFEARMMDAMLSGYERDARVQPGDELLLARINAQALGTRVASGRERSTRRRGRALAFVLAAAVLLMASLAAAWIAHTASGRSGLPAPSPALARVDELKRAARPSVANQPRRPTPDVKEPLPEAPASELPSPARASVNETPQAQRSAEPRTSELFARANSLRRAGQLTQAAQLYQTLLERSPRAREAQPARLALANLLAKQPAQALVQYRALAQSGGGTFRLQGLWGMAETAASQGDRATESAALSELVRDFPGSPFAEIARQRLGNGNP